MIYLLLFPVLILILITVRVLWVKLRKPKINIPVEKLTDFQKEIIKDAENHKFVNYRGTILKLSQKEYELFLGATRKQRKVMKDLAMKGQDLTKHFKNDSL